MNKVYFFLSRVNLHDYQSSRNMNVSLAARTVGVAVYFRQTGFILYNLYSNINIIRYESF